jgi:selT/selW/selH-like putative selenoprotein
VAIIPGKTGSFEVFLGERRLFSKLESERFPEENEVEEQVGEALDAA